MMELLTSIHNAIEYIINHYLLLLFLPLFLLYVASLKASIHKIAESKPEIKPSAGAFIKGFRLGGIITIILLQTFQLLGGYKLSDTFRFTDSNPIFHILSAATVTICDLLFLYWIFFRNGAELLSIFSPALVYTKNLPKIKVKLPPNVIKVIALLMAGGSMAAVFFS